MKKIAFVYDWIDKWGGVERLLLILHKIFPKAPFFTSYVDSEKALWAKGLNLKTSFIQRLPNFIKKNRLLSFSFYPFAFESFDFSQYDIVISITSSFSKAIITKPKTFHLCYLLTPARYLWFMSKEYGVPAINYFKKCDYIAAQRPDKIISISKTVADRCRKYYGRESDVIYPPFDVDYWRKIKLKVLTPNFEKNLKLKLPTLKFYLIVSRLEPYKKVDFVIELFNQLGWSLVVVGEGSMKDRLKKAAKRNITFLSNLDDQELSWLYTKAQALIMAQEEDFGYVALESQFFGCPVIAYGKGGAKETVIENKTGIFFYEQKKESFLATLERFRIISYNLKKTTEKWGEKNVDKFDKNKFIKKIQSVLHRLLKIS